MNQLNTATQSASPRSLGPIEGKIYGIQNQLEELNAEIGALDSKLQPISLESKTESGETRAPRPVQSLVMENLSTVQDRIDLLINRIKSINSNLQL